MFTRTKQERDGEKEKRNSLKRERNKKRGNNKKREKMVRERERGRNRVPSNCKAKLKSLNTINSFDCINRYKKP